MNATEDQIAMPEDGIHMCEEIRAINGCDGYFVTDQGSVLSTRGKKIRKLKGVPTKGGYLRLKIRSGVRGIDAYIHHLVATAFHGERPTNDSECRHLNGNNQDNRASNLLWGTAQENADDRIVHGRIRRGESAYNAKLDDASVRQIIELIHRGWSQSRIAELFRVARSQVWMVATGRSWRHITGIARVK